MTEKESPITALEELSCQIFLEEDDAALDQLWSKVSILLMGQEVDAASIKQLMDGRDLNWLNSLIEGIVVQSKPATPPVMHDLDEEEWEYVEEWVEEDESVGLGAPTALTSDLPPLEPLPGGPVQEKQSGKSSVDPLGPEGLKEAMTAFRRRLKLKQDTASSREAEQLVAIQPPNQFPMSVWRKLVSLGELVDEGGGLYRLK
ncbi:hypothetical protein [Poriferisphaera sp. WC338]|uniref:hypothetical protein n=1 Tax=Poriferisphaera sp. WC338 TaxID=3425129 RepID=UPI003D81BE8B